MISQPSDTTALGANAENQQNPTRPGPTVSKQQTVLCGPPRSPSRTRTSTLLAAVGRTAQNPFNATAANRPQILGQPPAKRASQFAGSRRIDKLAYTYTHACAHHLRVHGCGWVCVCVWVCVCQLDRETLSKLRMNAWRTFPHGLAKFHLTNYMHSGSDNAHTHTYKRAAHHQPIFVHICRSKFASTNVANWSVITGIASHFRSQSEIHQCRITSDDFVWCSFAQFSCKERIQTLKLLHQKK